MKILYVVPYPPSLIRVRPYNLIRFLGARGHQVTVATLWSNESERRDAEALRGECADVQTAAITRARSLANCALALPTRTPLQAVYSWQPAFARKLRELANTGFDVIQVEHLRGSQYALFLHRHCPTIPIVWDSVDCISLLFRWASQHSRSLFGRLLTRFEVGRTAHYEGHLLEPFQRVLVTSPIDRQALGELARDPGSAARIKVLSNGVDLDYFTPGDPARRAPATIVVSGKMSYHANVTMVLYLVREIMPHVWPLRPDVRLQIVGKDPAPEIQALAAQQGVEVLGAVPEIRPYLQQASVAVTPILYGVGIQNKVLEAMACATPVVSTPQAVSALQARAGQDVLVAAEPQGFAQALLTLLDDPTRQRQIGNAGRYYVEKHHNWLNLAAELEDIYQEIGTHEH
ncbi:MAG: glycosyltransferase [Chloroflexota bacterium]